MFLAVTPDEVLYGYGPLGIGVVVLCAAVYKMFLSFMKDKDKAVNDRDTMIEDVFTKVLPAFDRNTQVLLTRQELDRELIDVLKDNTKVLEEVRFMLMHGRNNDRVGGS
jgi:hypothetical protein